MEQSVRVTLLQSVGAGKKHLNIKELFGETLVMIGTFLQAAFLWVLFRPPGAQSRKQKTPAKGTTAAKTKQEQSHALPVSAKQTTVAVDIYRR